MKFINKTITIASTLSALISTSVAAIELDFKLLEQTIIKVETDLSAYVGVTVFETDRNKTWSYNGNERFPLTSTFKTIACAKLLRDAENDRALLNSSVIVSKEQLVTHSPVTEKYVGKKITLSEACSATMLTSDNTAANIILNAVGGPSGITKFIRNSGDNISRLDRFEPELNEGTPGDLRDTTTPIAITGTLNELLFGSILSEKSKEQLKQWMMNNQVTGNLLRSVLPLGWEIADRSGGGGYGSRSITAIAWSQNQSPIIISIYITQTDASFLQRNEAIVKIGKSIFNIYTQHNKG